MTIFFHYQMLSTSNMWKLEAVQWVLLQQNHTRDDFKEFPQATSFPERTVPEVAWPNVVGLAVTMTARSAAS